MHNVICSPVPETCAGRFSSIHIDGDLLVQGVGWSRIGELELRRMNAIISNKLIWIELPRYNYRRRRQLERNRGGLDYRKQEPKQEAKMQVRTPISLATTLEVRFLIIFIFSLKYLAAGAIIGARRETACVQRLGVYRQSEACQEMESCWQTLSRRREEIFRMLASIAPRRRLGEMSITWAQAIVIDCQRKGARIERSPRKTGHAQV